jgi:hypothetical protein
MDSRKTVLFGSLIVFGLVTAGIMYWLLKFRSVEIAGTPVPQTEEKPAQIKPEEMKQPEAPPPAAMTSNEIVFEKTLQIEDKQIIVDGGAAQIIPCEAVPQLFGYVKVDADTTGELTCETDYPGGIKLRIKDAGVDTQPTLLQAASGDAGDVWDSRSLLSREKDGRLRIDLISVSSSDNIDTPEEEASCTLRETSLVWDRAAKQFLGANPGGQFSLKMFRLPIAVSKLCLDEQGNFKN